MHRCEHGQKITKFCVTEHCHHKEAAGCEYCIRKYHFHLTNTLLLSEADVEELVKRVSLPSDTKYKTRHLQEAATDYLRTIRNSLNNWFDHAEKSIAQRLSHPLLRKRGFLSTYNRLKYKEYRKVNSKDLRGLNEFSKSNSPEDLKKEEMSQYFQEVDWTKSILEGVERLALEMSKLPQVKQDEPALTTPSKSKLVDIFDTIAREKSRSLTLLNNTSSSGFKFEESSLLKRRLSEEKKDFALNKQPIKNANQVKLVRENSCGDQPRKRTTLSQEQEAANDALKNIPADVKDVKKQEQTQKVSRLKKRRSSIDEKLDFKFGASIEEARQCEQRKKKLIENVLSKDERKASQQKVEKKEEQKVKKQVDINIGNYMSLKYGKKEEVKKEEFKPANKAENGQTEIVNEANNKADEQNFPEAVMKNLVNSLLPPPPPSKHINSDSIDTKLVKIPVVMRDIVDEVQSPILKNRRKQSNVSTPSPFSITLNSANKDEVTEKPQFTVQKSEEKESENKGDKKTVVNQKQEDKDDFIVLQHKEKNSLLLFSEALRSQPDKAIELLKAALKYSPNNLSAAEYLSYLYLEGCRAKQCLEVCEAILISIQDTPEEFQLTLHLHNNRAAALNMLGRYSESIMILEKCLRARKKHYFYKNLADAYFCLGISEKATVNYEKALKLDPEYDQAYYNLAVAQFMQEECTSALMNVQEALRIQKTNDAYIELEREVQRRRENITV